MQRSILSTDFIQPIKIYAADDDADDMLFLKDAFDSINFPGQIETFSHGLTLWETITQHKSSIPDLFIIDLNMPFIKGFELIERLNSLEQFHSIPKIVLSTSNNIVDVKKSQKLNCLAYFQKPASFLQFNQLAVKIISEYNNYVNKKLNPYT